MDSSPLSLPAVIRAITPTSSHSRAATPARAAIPIRVPTPASTPATELADDNLPQHTKPSRIKVKELPEKERARAESIARHLSEDFDDTRYRAALSQITKVRDESHIRPKRGDRTGWALLQVEKRQQRETMPTKTRTDTPSRPPQRLAVSAPVMLKQSLVRPVPGSPMGNAWSGEHFWKPEFCESEPASPFWEAGGCAHSDAERQGYYNSVVADVEKCALEVKFETAHGVVQMSNAECDVVAAMTVLEEMKESFGEDDWPVPIEIISRIDKFAAEVQEALSLNPIRELADICESSSWLSFEQSSLQPLTKLDEVRGRLKMIKETKRTSGVEPSEQGYRLVYAVQILEEKIRTLKLYDSYAHDSDNEKMEYGNFLKSLAEVMPWVNRKETSITSCSSDNELGEGSDLSREMSKTSLEQEPLLVRAPRTLAERRTLRRDVSESGLERRRLRGIAPSTLDLESWASSLKVLDDKRKAGNPNDENRFV